MSYQANQPTCQEIRSFQQEVKIYYEDGKPSYILRIIKGDISWWSFDNTNILEREVNALRICLLNNVPVPKVLKVDSNKELNQYTMTVCPGKDMKKCIDNKENIPFELFFEI